MTPNVMVSLPVVDLALQPSVVATAIRHACESRGFFYVTNHDVPREAVDAMFHAAREFFSLPVHLKQTVLQDHNNRGWTPMGEETLDPSSSKRGDSKEGYYIGREAEEDEIGLPLRGANNWPDEEKLGLVNWRRVMEAYHDEMSSLARRLMPVFAEALGLEKNFFDEHFRRPTALLRPLHYAASESSPGEGVFAAGAHSDYGVLTILAVDAEAPGLEIQEANGSWTPVAGGTSGGFCVNIGDLCERWTNGRFRSTVHRVVTKQCQGERWSAAFFWEPEFDVVVTPIVREGEKPHYEPCKYGDYILGKYAATHEGFKDS
ncbi:2-oxoglutarate-Fe(II) type oxidoreductase [Pycnococcus provasolii]